eukprot:c27179_g1_i1 orf=522-1688(+)
MIMRASVKLEGISDGESLGWPSQQFGEDQKPKRNAHIEREAVSGDFRHDYNNGQSTAERRSIRARYRALKDDIAVGKEVFTRLDSEKFNHVISSVENLHNLVRRPREQIADAEALLGITSTFLASVKDARRTGGVSPADFVAGIVQNFGSGMLGDMNADTAMSNINWKALGSHACAVFSDAPGMGTMLGPMESQPKTRKVSAQRRVPDRQVESTRPQEIEDSSEVNEKSETDKNMEAMFRILKRLKSVPLESLVLNRHSFSQTVENIFALSFLVKDGRAEISIVNGGHMVAPKNFPTPQQREKGEGSMEQFVFRFDYKDWKIMCDTLEQGKEVMAHRTQSTSQGGSVTPVRKYCRNRAMETPAINSADQIQAEGLQDVVDSKPYPIRE